MSGRSPGRDEIYINWGRARTTGKGGTGCWGKLRDSMSYPLHHGQVRASGYVLGSHVVPALHRAPGGDGARRAQEIAREHQQQQQGQEHRPPSRATTNQTDRRMQPGYTRTGVEGG